MDLGRCDGAVGLRYFGTQICNFGGLGKQARTMAGGIPTAISGNAWSPSSWPLRVALVVICSRWPVGAHLKTPLPGCLDMYDLTIDGTEAAAISPHRRGASLGPDGRWTRTLRSGSSIDMLSHAKGSSILFPT